jgi:hypothetical protein
VVPGDIPGLPVGYEGTQFDVTSPGVTETLRGEIAVKPAIGAPRGLVAFFTGGGGTQWWSDQVVEAYDFAENLRILGFWIVQVRWTEKWWASSPGNDAGIAHLGCRPATAIRYIFDTYYAPLGIPKIVGRAGFCITGNSGGSSQVAYALTHFGLDSILDVVIPSSGPVHATLAKSCLRNPGEENYWYSSVELDGVDEAFGYFGGGGPAATHDVNFAPRWLEESHATGGNDYVHPTTRVHIILGEDDQIMIKTIATDYSNRLVSEGTPYTMLEVVPATPHRIMETAAGRAAILSAILAEL